MTIGNVKVKDDFLNTTHVDANHVNHLGDVLGLSLVKKVVKSATYSRMKK